MKVRKVTHRSIVSLLRSPNPALYQREESGRGVPRFLRGVHGSDGTPRISMWRMISNILADFDTSGSRNQSSIFRTADRLLKTGSEDSQRRGCPRTMLPRATSSALVLPSVVEVQDTSRTTHRTAEAFSSHHPLPGLLVVVLPSGCSGVMVPAL